MSNLTFFSIDITTKSYQNQFPTEKQLKDYANLNQEQLMRRRNPTLPPIDKYQYRYVHFYGELYLLDQLIYCNFYWLSHLYSEY